MSDRMAKTWKYELVFTPIQFLGTDGELNNAFPANAAKLMGKDVVVTGNDGIAHTVGIVTGWKSEVVG